MWSRYGSPAFVIPGAQKCGTTALAVFLARHPRLQLATEKEPDFFSRDSRYRDGGYHRLFPRPLFRRPVFFEASVSYFAHPAAPERLAAFDPGLHFVVMVREPAARAYSAWNMYRRFFSVPSERARFEAWLEDRDDDDRAAGAGLLAQAAFPSFAEAVEGELEALARRGPSATIPALVAGGLYATHLERFLAAFPRERFLVLEDRELADAPAHTLDRVLDFLELEPHDWGDTFPKVFAGDYEEPPDDAVLARLRAFYAPHNRRLDALVGRSFGW